MTAPIPILLDTDIGTDVDDLLALLTVVGDPALELVGLTATYGDTVLRARILKQLCDQLGITVPIGAGPTRPLSGRPIWLAGHEAEQLEDEAAAAFQPAAAADVIDGAVRAHGDRLVIAGLGPATNLALALRRRRLPDGIRLLLMGGDYTPTSRPEHNFACDAMAASEVMATGHAVRVIGVDQTRRIRLPRATVDALVDGTGPLHAFVQRETRRWMAFNDEDYLLVHDPLAILMATETDHFTLTRGNVTVSTRTTDEGICHFEPAAAGTIEVVTDIDDGSLAGCVTDRIARALSRA